MTEKPIFASKAHECLSRFELLVIQMAPTAVTEAVLGFIRDPLVHDRLLKAPASTAERFHHAWEGGLMEHILDVYEIADYTASGVGKWKSSVLKWELLLVALIHDLHKIGDSSGVDNFIPNILKSGKRSDAIPYISNPEVNAFHSRIAGLSSAPDDGERMQEQGAHILMTCLDLLPEGEISLSLVRAISPVLFALLSDDVKFAVRHHDGMYGRAKSELMGGKETPLMVVFHYADMVSSRKARWEALGVIK